MEFCVDVLGTVFFSAVQAVKRNNKNTAAIPAEAEHMCSHRWYCKCDFVVCVVLIAT